MKITSVNAQTKTSYINRYKFDNGLKFQAPPCDTHELKALNPELLKIYYVGFGKKKRTSFESDFKYRPLSKIKPDYKPLNCDFNNLGEFYELYAQKINSQLMPISKGDIEDLIRRLKESTAANESLIREVLYKLTYYSSYTNLDRIQELINKYKIGEFRSDDLEDGNVFINSSNTALNYISLSKRLLRTSINANKTAYILDDGLLSYLETCQKSSNPIEKERIKRLKEAERKGDMVFLNLPAWDIKCSDGKYRSAVFLYGSGFLEQIAKETILKVQNGEDINDVLYGDFSKRLKNILGEDTETYQPKIEAESFGVDDIFENLKTPLMSKRRIKDTVWKFFRIKLMSSETKGDVVTFLKFADENTYVFSPDSFAMNLINIHEKINKMTAHKKSKAFYIVPEALKSFDYVTVLYSKLNQIEDKDIARIPASKDWQKHPRKKDLKIILDDICASGETQRERCAEIEYASANYNILFACLLASRYALMRSNDDEILTQYTFEDLPYKIHEQEYNIIYDILSDNGYMDISSSGAFPYMTPDSDNEFSSYLFDALICRTKA